MENFSRACMPEECGGAHRQVERVSQLRELADLLTQFQHLRLVKPIARPPRTMLREPDRLGIRAAPTPNRFAATGRIPPPRLGA